MKDWLDNNKSSTWGSDKTIAEMTAEYENGMISSIQTAADAELVATVKPELDELYSSSFT